jgi:glycosyltransferase involved in cell wall biosynthesis
MKSLLFTSLYYFSDRPGGSGRLSCELAHEFARSGYKVYMLVSDVADTGVTNHKEGNLELIRYQNKTPKIIGFLKPWLTIHRVKKALKENLKEDIEIIHGHDLLSYLGSITFLKGKEIKKVYTAHSPATKELNIVWRSEGKLGWLKCVLGLPLIKHFEKKCLMKSDHVTAESSFTIRELLRTYGGNALTDYTVVPGWVDVESFNLRHGKKEARARLDWPPDKTILFCLRRLVARMGIENLIMAVHILVDRGFDLHLMIGGDGPLRTTLLSEITRLNLEDNVTLLGRLKDEELPMAYSACDISVVPTLELEGFGIIALESLACGRPVLATPVGALPELITVVEPEWLAEHNNAESIANLIMRYLYGEIAEHDPKSLHNIVVDKYSFSEAFGQYKELLFN